MKGAIICSPLLGVMSNFQILSSCQICIFFLLLNIRESSNDRSSERTVSCVHHQCSVKTAVFSFSSMMFNIYYCFRVFNSLIYIFSLVLTFRPFVLGDRFLKHLFYRLFALLLSPLFPVRTFSIDYLYYF